jgi:hypothetical protein
MAQFSVKIMRLTGSVLGENQQTEHASTETPFVVRAATAKHRF